MNHSFSHTPFACYAGADLCGIPFFTVALGYCLHSCARYASGVHTPLHYSSHYNTF
jgi:L-asparaginase II